MTRLPDRLTNTKYATVALALVLTIVGFGLLYVGSQVTSRMWSIFTYNLGSFVIASVAIAIIFQFFQLKNLLRDIYEAVGVSDAIRRSGLTGFTLTFHGEVDWQDLFRSSNNLDIIFAYGSTWRNANQQYLEQLLADPEARVRAVLPDIEYDVVIEELADRFGYTSADLRQRIEEAERDFQRLDDRTAGSVAIYRMEKSMLYSAYRFDSRSVITSYRYRDDRGKIVTLVGKSGGELYQWLRNEVRGIIEAPFSERVYPTD